ncbi:YadA-like family protein [Dyella sp. LX-66]|uniref:YadA family autotransporter adhesin n=1 Tax=unclassified Dyella TaxID=2634549 RepID=UPI001BE0D82B|nr:MULTISPECIES: YadA-like family protein [unclassified Dyella]MBT2117515.1 YadA-like family protein [Dyella sp. LX-1]MBT2119360.1 YadA-like family protein [Dyella sp. LX-1]MBT2138579.1 YadA-like family protein [Dyella sp. LX-66]
MNKSCNENRRASSSLRAPVLAACLALYGMTDAPAQSAPTGTTTSGPGAAANGDRGTAVGENALADQADATTTGAGSAALGIAASAYGASSIANADESVAVGYRSFANDANSTALGANASAYGYGASAFGGGASTNASYATAAGFGAAASGLRSTAYGEGAQATAAGSVAIGGRAVDADGNPTLKDDAGAPIEASATSSGVLGTAVGAGASAAGARASAFGAGSEASAEDSTALGSLAKARAEKAVAIGSEATVTGASGVALGADSSASMANSVALGAGSKALRANTVSVGSAGAERQITDVAAGTQATDAVNLSQLQSVLGSSVGSINVGLGELNSRLAALDQRVATGYTKDPAAATGSQVQEALTTAKSYADAGDRQTLGQAKAYTDRKLSGLASRRELDDLRQRVNDQFHTLDTRINRVGAIGVAMSLMSASTQGLGESGLGVAVGGYRSEAALSVGFSRQIGSRARLIFGTAIAGGGETAGGVGLGIGL